MVEIGSYCGRSTVWLGAAARAAGTVLFAVDHHRGSEENQAGWEHHDPTVVDPRTGRWTRCRSFRATIHDAGLEDVVIAVVGQSLADCPLLGDAAVVRVHRRRPRRGAGPPRLRGVVSHTSRIGGMLAIHDVFPDPADGGRPPYEQIYLPALRSGAFTEIGAAGSLRLLRRTAP